MLFCKDCGTALNLFGSKERELCSSCIQHKKKAAPPAVPIAIASPQTPEADILELLADTVLSYENSKMVLRSKEGWELWSGAPGTKSELKSILVRARRIYEIRLRRQKN